MSANSNIELVHYIPLLTTIIAAIFAPILFKRWASRGRSPHLLWWGLGVVAYGIGTALEAGVTLFGNTVFLTKAWYIAGALFGGYPLAQGTAYLLLDKKRALICSYMILPLVAVLSIATILTPVDMDALLAHKPTGAIIEWTWIRWGTPIVNIFAVIFLVGGAIWSSIKFAKKRGPGDGNRAFGTGMIAAGGLMPAIGGSMAKAGITEALYIGEFVGLIFIWIGFHYCVKGPRFVPEAEAVAS